MTQRANHYEAAFEYLLRCLRVPYVAVDETRRTLAVGTSLKSLDFVVSGPDGQRWLVDVKGRQFPSGQRRKYWNNWATEEDLHSLARWERLFGAEFSGLLVFAYCIVGELAPLPEDQLLAFRNRLYAFVAIRRADYAQAARRISPRWKTVSIPTEKFRSLARAAHEWFGVPWPDPALRMPGPPTDDDSSSRR
jgi:hypothetical protein